MGKNELDDDLLVSGGKSSSNSKNAKNKEKSAKKAEKAKAAIKKKSEKLSAKKESLEKELDGCNDDKKKEKLSAEIKDIDKKLKTLSSGKKLTMSKSTKKAIQTVVIVVVVVALLSVYVATGAVRKGFVSYLSIPQNTLTGLVIKDSRNNDKIKIKVGTYNYYYATTYNNLKSQQSQLQQYNIDVKQANLDVDFDKPLSKQYTKDSDSGKKITWQEYIHNNVLDTILSTYTYYNEAVKANNGKEPSITDDQKKELKETLDNYESSAKQYGYTLSGYLVKAMGKGVTSTLMRKEMTISYIAKNYQESLSSGSTKTNYTDKDFEKYKKENEDALLSVNIRIFECASEDDAKAFYKDLKSDASNFTQLAGKYASKLDNGSFYKTAYAEDAGYSTENYATKTVLQNKKYAIATADSKKKYPGLDWLFSKDRKSGDAKQYSTTVVYVTKPVNLSDVKTVNVRHILIAPETSSSSSSSSSSAVSATTAQWKTAYEKAQSVLKEWKKGKATEDTFATLAKSNSSDSNKDDGGLYENIYPGQMVNSFGTWCFDTSRKTGDTAIVKSDYGYHVMYFVKANSMEAWKYTAQQALASGDSETMEKAYSIDENWFGSRYFEIDTDIDN